MICTSLQNKTYTQILEILEDPTVEMAEIRLDLCPLSDEEIEELFSESDTPLIATCRADGCASPEEAARRLRLAIEAGARFADLEIEAPAQTSKNFQHLCRKRGTEIIRSYHNYEQTPDDEGLQMALARCFRYGADIAKVVTACRGPEDAARLEALYSLVLEDVDSLQGRLVAFGMGEAGRQSRCHGLDSGPGFRFRQDGGAELDAAGRAGPSAVTSDAHSRGRFPQKHDLQTIRNHARRIAAGHAGGALHGAAARRHLAARPRRRRSAPDGDSERSRRISYSMMYTSSPGAAK